MMTKIIEVSVMEAQIESVQMTGISYYRTKIAIMKINNIQFSSLFYFSVNSFY